MFAFLFKINVQNGRVGMEGPVLTSLAISVMHVHAQLTGEGYIVLPVVSYDSFLYFKWKYKPRYTMHP